MRTEKCFGCGKQIEIVYRMPKSLAAPVVICDDCFITYDIVISVQKIEAVSRILKFNWRIEPAPDDGILII